MRVLTLQREGSNEFGTFGHAVSDDNLSLYSLELPWRDNHTETSCIPAGNYVCHWAQSPHHGWCYHVNDVPGRSHILIHAANFAGDFVRGWEAELKGCIAMGTAIGPLENVHHHIQQALYNSKLGIRKLNEWGGGAPFLLKIILSP